jgi:hypothetical protein
MSAPSVQTQAAERAAIASSLGYPSRCVRVSISIGISDYARANLGHGTGCSRYHGYVNGSFHRVDGSWRLVLDEGQLFVPNRLLAPRTVPRGCLRLAIAFHDPWAASHHRVCTRARSR